MSILDVARLFQGASDEVKDLAEQILREGQQHPDIPLEHSETAQQILLSLGLPFDYPL